MVSFKDHVGVTEGITELGNAIGIQNEIERLQQELDKHRQYEEARIKTHNPVPETDQGLRLREQNKKLVEEMQQAAKEFQRQLTHFSNCESLDPGTVSTMVETNAKDKIQTVMAEYATHIQTIDLKYEEARAELTNTKGMIKKAKDSTTKRLKEGTLEGLRTTLEGLEQTFPLRNARIRKTLEDTQALLKKLTPAMQQLHTERTTHMREGTADIRTFLPQGFTKQGVLEGIEAGKATVEEFALRIHNKRCAFAGHNLGPYKAYVNSKGTIAAIDFGTIMTNNTPRGSRKKEKETAIERRKGSRSPRDRKKKTTE